MSGLYTHHCTSLVVICGSTDGGYSAQLIKSELQMMLKDRQFKDEEFVEQAQLLGLPEEEFWSDTDDYEAAEVTRSGKIVQGQEMEELLSDEPDLTASLMDVLYDDIAADSGKRKLNVKEQVRALEALNQRQR